MSRKFTKFWAAFYEFEVYIFLMKVLSYLLIIFLKITIDTLYEENGSRKIPPGKFPPGIFPPISLIDFLYLTWVKVFKNMGENIPGGNFPEWGNFPGGVDGWEFSGWKLSGAEFS